jgi:DNA-binding NarL/FixJ family response regulator
VARTAAQPEIRNAACDAPAVTVAADDRAARNRIASALAARHKLALHAAASSRDLAARGVLHGLLVLHCDSIGPGELALLGELRRDAPDVPIVAVCESLNDRSARRAVDAGVDGLVLAAELGAALPPTVAAVLAGQLAVPRALRATLSKPSLSFREKQILGMVVMGFTNSEIGGRLFLTESTVKSHLSSAFRKLGVRSRNEAADLILDPHGSLGTRILAITSDVKSDAA